MKLIVWLPICALASNFLALTALVRDSDGLVREVPQPVDAVVPHFPFGPFIPNMNRFWDRFTLTVMAVAVFLTVLHLDYFITFEVPGYEFYGDEATVILYLIFFIFQLLWEHIPTTMVMIIGLELLMAAAMGLLS